MSGLVLIIFAVLGLVFFVIAIIDDYNDEGWLTTSAVCFIVAFIFAIAIPISRIDSKTNAAYAKVLQETIDKNRQIQLDTESPMDVMERMSIIEEINDCNQTITAWRVKGQKWYNNKWYYHPDTQKAEYIK